MTYPVIGEDDLRALDVPSLLALGLQGGKAPAGTIAIAAALVADDLGTQPRSLSFLAEVVRRGGTAYAATLPEPLPTAEQATLATSWLEAVNSIPERCPGHDEMVARWLEKVALIVQARRDAQ